jgi:hypothetical protein
MTRWLKEICIALGCLFILQACGGSEGAYNPKDEDDVAPTAVVNLAGNAGDRAVSLGWEAPAKGIQPISYDVTIQPQTANAVVTNIGTRTLIRGLSNNTSYTFSITASNKTGKGPATTISLKPTAVDTNLFAAIARDLNDLNSPSGITDASLLNTDSALWMAYSSVHYYQQSSLLIQDMSTSLAYSNNGGTSFTYLKTIGNASSASITPRTLNPCGNISCSGRWAYAAPFIVDDNGDPDSSKRYKLFAHKYFFYPQNTPAAIHELGAIVMWTAASPESAWSSEKVVLSWDATPLPLATTNNIKNINSALNECVALSDGSATVYKSALDFAFGCRNEDGTQKIVLLRSTDHASTFKYISTPLSAGDANYFDGQYFTAPSLIVSASNTPVLIATPVINRTINGAGNLNANSGCVVFPFADQETGNLFRAEGQPISILEIPYLANHTNGSCTWERGVSVGILMSDGNAAASIPFNLLNTAKSL